MMSMKKYRLWVISDQRSSVTIRKCHDFHYNDVYEEAQILCNIGSAILRCNKDSSDYNAFYEETQIMGNGIYE